MNLIAMLAHRLHLKDSTWEFLQYFLFPLNFIFQIIMIIIIIKWNQFLVVAIIEVIVMMGVAFCNYNHLVIFYWS